MIGRPEPSETSPYYVSYIDAVVGDDPLVILQSQLETALGLFAPISEEQSLNRYAAGKWTIRELLQHVTDTERAFAFRALWFARGFSGPLPGFDSDIAAAGADANRVSWADLVAEFRLVRLSTLTLFRNLSDEAWMRTGIASNYPFTVRVLAFITAGHVEHHLRILRERYLREFRLIRDLSAEVAKEPE
jgi:hypothetical protein